ncbi:protein mono-ADP-ribosyltransferase PARP10 isoform X2 [Pithys albifrons albifrons]|uniref:protein mono-ADP-ribosyltransferase PARP10 isoform X2 n=1 Tax=Pithys albifrons albifrons TaxID=3385563 RepID=UPI003A5D1F69
MAEGVLEVHGVPPNTPEELLVLYFESQRRSGGGPVQSCQSLGPLFFLTFEDPQELASAEQRAQRRGLALRRVPQTPAVLVRVAGPALSRDLLELYFENRRSGGGCVQEVQLLPGGHGAIVTFQELAAVERVLQRPHRLQDEVLELSPHYPFLEPLEWNTDPPLDTAPHPLDTAPPLDTIPLLDRDSPRDTEPSPDTDPSPDTSPALNTAPAVSEPAAPADLRASHPVPVQPLPTFPSRDKDTEGVETVTNQGCCLEPASVVAPEPVSALLAQDEMLVPAEPGALQYLRRHYQDLLGSIPEVSLLPLEAGDVTGFRVSGELGRCRAAADFLQSLLSSVASHPVTLHFPGVARFLRDLCGQSLLQELESRFQCVIHLDGIPWSPPDLQLELEELLPVAPHSWHQDLPECNNGADDDSSDGDGFCSNIEEIKELLAALRPDEADDHKDPEVQPDAILSIKWDPDAKFLDTDGGEGAEKPLLGTGLEEEEAEMALAIQYSMDSTQREEEDLARATALSLRSYCQEQEQVEQDAGLLAALGASLEEALLAADTAQVTVFCSFERDVSEVQQELERTLAGRLRPQEVESDRLRTLPAAGHHALALLQCRHAVHVNLCGSTATVHGFAEYTAPAAHDLAMVLQCRPLPEHGATAGTTATTATAHWVRWDPSGTVVPYAPEVAAQLEQAWLRRERRLDLLLDGRPFTVDLERMEEYDIGSARAVPVCRSQPPAESAHCLLGPEVPGMEEEVRLMPLAEDSEEFADTVHHFYGTLEKLHNRIIIVKVQKLIHPVLYKQYQLKKGSVERACATGTATERVLFHGTTKASSREICLHGFNRSFCGKNATHYGRGVYFAVRAALSARDRYSPPSADGTKFIFMAKVVTGMFTAGHRGLRAPPLREDAMGPQRYHSVVDNVQQPEIFVIFNDTQAYPQYLITCRHRRDPL